MVFPKNPLKGKGTAAPRHKRRIYIKDSMTISQRFSSFTVYVLDVRYNGLVWHVQRRYSDFRTLKDQLLERYPKEKFLTYFPPAKRRAMLEAFIQLVVDKTRLWNTREVQEFLVVKQAKRDFKKMKRSVNRAVRIVDYETVEGKGLLGRPYTEYIIEVKRGDLSWTVRHRYSEFRMYADQLVTAFPDEAFLRNFPTPSMRPSAKRAGSAQPLSMVDVPGGYGSLNRGSGEGNGADGGGGAGAVNGGGGDGGGGGGGDGGGEGGSGGSGGNDGKESLEDYRRRLLEVFLVLVLDRKELWRHAATRYFLEVDVHVGEQRRLEHESQLQNEGLLGAAGPAGVGGEDGGDGAAGVGSSGPGGGSGSGSGGKSHLARLAIPSESEIGAGVVAERKEIAIAEYDASTDPAAFLKTNNLADVISTHRAIRARPSDSDIGLTKNVLGTYNLFLQGYESKLGGLDKIAAKAVSSLSVRQAADLKAYLVARNNQGVALLETAKLILAVDREADDGGAEQCFAIGTSQLAAPLFRKDDDLYALSLRNLAFGLYDYGNLLADDDHQLAIEVYTECIEAFERLVSLTPSPDYSVRFYFGCALVTLSSLLTGLGVVSQLQNTAQSYLGSLVSEGAPPPHVRYLSMWFDLYDRAKTNAAYSLGAVPEYILDTAPSFLDYLSTDRPLLLLWADVLEKFPPSSLKPDQVAELVEEKQLTADFLFSPPSQMLCYGYLYKVGGINKNWLKRFFVLTASTLIYCESPNDALDPKKQLAVADFRNVAEKRVSDKVARKVGVADGSLGFQLELPKRTFTFVARSVGEKTVWMDTLREAMSNVETSVATLQHSAAVYSELQLADAP